MDRISNRIWWLSLLLLLIVFVTGCQSQVPKDALRLSPETLEQRQMQTRRFDGVSETDILSASAGVMQDLGFNLDGFDVQPSGPGDGIVVDSCNRTLVTGKSAGDTVIWRYY